MIRTSSLIAHTYNRQFDKYVKTAPDAGAEESNTPAPDSPKTKKGYGTKWIQDAVRKQVENERKTHNLRKELKEYVDGHLEVDVNLIKWWGVRVRSTHSDNMQY